MQYSVQCTMYNVPNSFTSAHALSLNARLEMQMQHPWCRPPPPPHVRHLIPKCKSGCNFATFHICKVIITTDTVANLHFIPPQNLYSLHSTLLYTLHSTYTLQYMYNLQSTLYTTYTLQSTLYNIQSIQSTL